MVQQTKAQRCMRVRYTSKAGALHSPERRLIAPVCPHQYAMQEEEVITSSAICLMARA